MTGAERGVYQRARRSFERGDDEAALAQLTRLLQTRDGFADVHYMVGLLHERRNDYPQAVRSLRQALRINPSYTEALLALASVYERQGDFDRSQELARRARRTERRSDGTLDATTRGKLANLQAVLADAYREVGELREAIEGYRKALDRCPDFHDIRHRLGITLREAGLPDRALAEFRRVRRGNPSFLDATVQMGVTLYSLGRIEEAAREWRAVLDKDPTRDDARMYLRMVGEEADGDPRGE
jgi:tetratricopeptide (TPR) repeat protein